MTNTNEPIKCAFAKEPAGAGAILGLTAYFLALSVLLAAAFICVWCSLEEAITQEDGKVIMNNLVATVSADDWFRINTKAINGVDYLIIPDSFAILTVLLSGAFGGLIHAIRSFYYHVVEGDLQQSEMFKLALRPASGAILALIFYLVLRAGLGQGKTADPSGTSYKGASILFYTAIGAIVGMFTDQTVAKLKKIAEAILTKPEPPEKPKMTK